MLRQPWTTRSERCRHAAMLQARGRTCPKAVRGDRSWAGTSRRSDPVALLPSCDPPRSAVHDPLKVCQGSTPATFRHLVELGAGRRHLMTCLMLDGKQHPHRCQSICGTTGHSVELPYLERQRTARVRLLLHPLRRWGAHPPEPLAGACERPAAAHRPTGASLDMPGNG
jgi:hypothetical protein